MCVTWLIHLCVMTHLLVPLPTHSRWNDSIICVTRLIHMCDMTHSYVWHESRISSQEGPISIKEPYFRKRASSPQKKLRCNLCLAGVLLSRACSWLIHPCDMTQILNSAVQLVFGGSYCATIYEPVLMIHSYMWLDSHIDDAVQLVIGGSRSVKTHGTVHDSFINVKWLR